MRRSFRFPYLLLVLTLVVSSAYAQTTISTGALSGTVRDSSGARLAGVTVTVTGARLQGSRSAVTDTEGQYVIPLLPPGTYRATFELSGIKPQSRQNVV